jgi:hypothetical protein
LEELSPEQISQHANIGPATVYQRAYAEKKAGGLLGKSYGARKNERSVMAHSNDVERFPIGSLLGIAESLSTSGSGLEIES